MAEETTLVDKILLDTGSPFTRRVRDVQVPENFEVPRISSFAGIGDPAYHWRDFRDHMNFYGTPGEVACRAFPLTLSGHARDWFNRLPLNSIDNFEALGRMFLTEFLPWRTRKRPWVYLLTIKQRHDETLKEFIARFNVEKMAVENPTDDIVYVALYGGFSPEGPLITKLGWKQPSTLQGLMDIVEEFIKDEEIKEILKAMASSRRQREKRKRRE